MSRKPKGSVEVHRQFISVPFAYPVYFTRDVWRDTNPIIAEVLKDTVPCSARVLVYVDSGVAKAHPALLSDIDAYANVHKDVLQLAADPVILPGGETVKDGWTHVNRVIDDMAKARLCRHSYVIAVGGGAVLDAVGFAAALVHRGVRHIRIPTTTLSQGDSGVGVKNGVNLNGVKNMVGSFAPPFAVIIDFSFLKTLGVSLTLDGIAEAFKVAIIKDARFFDYLKTNVHAISVAEAGVVEEAVRRCAILHLNHIQAANDPFEFGVSRPLDFGHWAAHRLESVSAYRIRHGQAVSIGIALDTCYAWKKKLISNEEKEDILSSLGAAGLPLYDSLLSQRDKAGKPHIIEGLEQFREHLGGTLSVTLPKSIGNRVEVHDMDTAVIEEALGHLEKLVTAR